MHAQVGANDRFHMRRPPEPRLINDTLHPTSAGRPDIDLHTPDLLMLGPLDWSEERITHHGMILSYPRGRPVAAIVTFLQQSVLILAGGLLRPS
jgi:hypothetical protein